MKVLDLILSNSNKIENIERCDGTLVLEDAYHPAFEFIFDFNRIEPLTPATLIVSNINKGNNDSINASKNETLWGDMFINEDLDEDIDVFYRKINDLNNLHVPKMKKMQNISDYVNFKRIRYRVQKLTVRDYARYISSVESGMVDDPKKIFSFSSVKNKYGSLPNTI